MLQYRRHCDRFGMFFLDTLDLEKEGCLIEEILQEDDGSVRRILGPLVRKPRKPMARREEEEEDLRGYPIGERPTWRQIRRSLEMNPTILIRRWEGLSGEMRRYKNASEGSIEEMGSRVFMKFTQQMWMALHEEWRIEATVDIAPRTIEEALMNWMVDFVLQHCVNPMFVACNTGLKHVRGRQVASFGERVEM